MCCSLLQVSAVLAYEWLGEILVPEEALVSPSPLWLLGSSRVFLDGGEALLGQSDVSAVRVEELLTKDARVTGILYQLHQPAMKWILRHEQSWRDHAITTKIHGYQHCQSLHHCQAAQYRPWHCTRWLHTSGSDDHGL